MGNIIFIKKNKITPDKIAPDRIAPDRIAPRMMSNRALSIKIPIEDTIEEDTPNCSNLYGSSNNFSNTNLHNEYLKYSLSTSKAHIDNLLNEYKQFIAKLFEIDYLNEDSFFILTTEI